MVVLAGAAMAQGERARQIAERALDDLAVDTLCRDATRRLVNLGAAAVPQLRERLAWPTRREQAPEVTARMAEILGRIGRPAILAFPELRDGIREEPPAGEGAVRALAALSPFVTREQRAALRADLVAIARTVDRAAVRMLEVATLLSDDGSTPTVRAYLCEAAEAERMATCRWLVATDGALRDDRSELTTLLAAELHKVTARAAISWVGPGPGSWAAPDLATAWLALSAEPLDGAAARGLLASADPDQRLRAVAWMHENGARLPVAERADLVARLWDVDFDVVRATCKALAAWGDAGLVALAPLHAFCQSHEDLAVRKHCHDAAATIVAAATAGLPAEAPWLAAFDELLAGRATTLPATPLGALGRRRIHEVLHLAQWHDSEPVGQLLVAIEAADACTPDAVCSVFGWLPHHDADVVAHACAWLARRGTAVRDAVWEHLPQAFEATCLGLPRYRVAANARPEAVELLAHLATAGASRLRLVELLEDGNLRVVARALAAGIAAGPATFRDASPRLHALLAAEPTPGVIVRAHSRDRGIVLEGDITAPMQALAAIALVGNGDPVPPAPLADAFLREQFAFGLGDLATAVESRRTAGTLAAMLATIENEVRDRLGVAGNLRWP